MIKVGELIWVIGGSYQGDRIERVESFNPARRSSYGEVRLDVTVIPNSISKLSYIRLNALPLPNS